MFSKHAFRGAQEGARALSCVMTSAETESKVTKTASFLVVPASRREWASTRAPIGGLAFVCFLEKSLS